MATLTIKLPDLHNPIVYLVAAVAEYENGQTPGYYPKLVVMGYDFDKKDWFTQATKRIKGATKCDTKQLALAAAQQYREDHRKDGTKVLLNELTEN